MRNPVRLAVLLFAVSVPSLAAVPAAAQPPGGPSMPRLFGDFVPQPGAWAEYSVTDTAAGTEMKMSIVGKEGDAFWYEVENNADGGRNIIKILVTGDPNKSTENIKRMIIKSGDAAAMEMPADFIVMGRRRLPPTPLGHVKRRTTSACRSRVLSFPGDSWSSPSRR